MKPIRYAVTSLILLSMILLVIPSAAADPGTVTWDGGGGDELWSNPLNWDPDIKPASIDDITIDGGVTVRMDEDFTLENTLALRGSSALFINGGITLTMDDAGLSLQNGTLTNSGTIREIGSGTLGTSAIITISANGSLVNDSTGTLERIRFFNDGGSITNDGQIIGGSSVIQQADPGATFDNNGTVSDTDLVISAGPFNNNSSGVVNVSGVVPNTLNTNKISITAHWGGTFNNSGTVTNDNQISNSNVFDNSGLLTNNGSFTNTCGVTATFTASQGVFNNSGTLVGNPIVDECIVWDNDTGNGLWSEATNWNPDRLPGPSDYILISDKNGVATSVNLDINFTNDSGEIVVTNSSSAALIVNSGVTFTNNAQLRLNKNSTLTNEGTLLNDGSMVIAYGNFLMDNKNTLTNSGSIVVEDAPGTFRNSGTINNSGLIQLICGISFENTGTLAGTGEFATCKDWDGGGGDELWSNPLNWDPDIKPASIDDITIDGGVTVRMDEDFTFENTLALRGSSALFINGGITLTMDDAGLSLQNGTLTNSGTIREIGSGTLGTSAIITISANGSLVNDSTGTLERIRFFNDGGSITNDGQIIGGSSVIQQADPGATFDNNGTVSDTDLVISAGPFNNNSSGVVNVSGVIPNTLNTNKISITAHWGGTFNNSGTVTNENMIRNLEGGFFDNFGTLDNTAGTFDNQGTFISECGSALLGTISGNPPVVIPCDTTPPVITIPADITAEATSVAGAIVSYAASAVDETDGPITPTCVPVSGSSFPLGTTTVTCTATDQAGNSASASFDVTVVDTTLPVLAIPPDVTAEANAMQSTVDIGTATATDIFLVTVVSNAPATFPLGTTPVTWTATDANGNSTSATQQVTVVDTTPPVLTIPPDVTVEANAVLSTVDIGTATASDIFPVTVSSDAPATFPLGTTPVTWTAIDTSGNSTSETQHVTVVDTIPPVLTVPPDVTTEANAEMSTVDIGTATATDIFPVTVTNDAPASFPLGITVVTWTATDSNGNSTTDTQTVTVVDTTPPALTIPPDVTVEASAHYGQPVDIGTATATDIADPTPVITNNAPALFQLGTTVVTWTATDASGNWSSDDQLVTVVDTIPPELTVPDDITVSAPSPTGAEVPFVVDVYDIADPDPELVCDHSSGELFPLGTTVVSCTATDGTGNSTSDSFAIHVIVAAETFEGYIDEIEALGLHQGTENSLVSKVEAALGSFENGNIGTTIDQLQAFINEVNAQEGKKISAEEAALLRSYAEFMIAFLVG